jgi:hypothetical protein
MLPDEYNIPALFTIRYKMDTVCYIKSQTSREAGEESETMSRKVVMETTTMMRITASSAYAS